MPFTDFANSKGEMQLDAMCEQFSLMIPLYWRDRDGLDSVLALCDPPAQVLAWNLRPDDGTENERSIPSHVILRQGTKVYTIIAGTEIGKNDTGLGVQWSGNLSGFFLREAWLDNRTFAHEFFAFCANHISANISGVIQDFTPTEFNISGHSLGGGVAFLLSTLRKKLRPTVPVNLMTFAAPRAMGEGYQGPVPDVNFRVINGYDAITVMPFRDGPADTFLSALGPGFKPLDTLRAYLKWDHYGKSFGFDGDGFWSSGDGKLAGVDNPFTVGATPPGGTTRWDEWAYHNSAAYLRMCSTASQRYGLEDERAGAMMAAAWRIADSEKKADSFSLPRPERFLNAAALNKALTGNSDGPVTPDNWRAFDIVTLTKTAGVALAAPFHTEVPSEDTEMANWKVLFRFGYGGSAWSESYYIKNISGVVDRNHPMITELATARAALLASNVNFKSIRASVVGSPHLADFGRYGGVFKQVKTLLAGDPTSCAVRLMQSLDKAHDRELVIRGYPKDWQGDRFADHTPFSNVDADTEQKYSTFLKVLFKFSETGPNWAIRVRNPGAAKNIAGISFDATTLKMQVLVDNTDANAYKVGDKIQISKVHGQGTSSLNGIRRVMKVDNTGLVLTLNHRKCDPCPLDPDNFGVYARPGEDFVEIRGGSAGFFASRSCGNDFFQRHGKRKGRCC